MASSDILLLDADIVAYALAAKAQKSVHWPGCEAPTVWLDDWAQLPQRIDDVVQALTGKLKTSNVVVCLSCPTVDNWRRDVLPSYKGNRDGVAKPEYLLKVKDYLESTYPSYRKPRLEADDIMGILSTLPVLPKALAGFDSKARRIIVSEDKDMKTIPGWLFNPAKDKAPRLIGESEADYWHLYQTLVGDSTDGYKGCPGVGPVKAKVWLDENPSWDLVTSAFKAAGLTEEDALVQARVARICRASDYDFNRKEVILWTPKNK